MVEINGLVFGFPTDPIFYLDPKRFKKSKTQRKTNEKWNWQQTT